MIRGDETAGLVPRYYFGRRSFILVFILTLLCCGCPLAISFHTCSTKEGGGICPNDSKCCAIPNLYNAAVGNKYISRTKQRHGDDDSNDEDGLTETSGCFPINPHIEGPGTCCEENSSRGRIGTADFGYNAATACPGNYTCGTNSSLSLLASDGDDGDPICILYDSFGEVVHTMPRYNLVPSNRDAIGHMYGLPILGDRMALGPVLAYYSNMGPILTSNRGVESKIEIAIVVVHGSGRNADEYLYSMMVASKMQRKYDPKNILVIAPAFLAPEDGVYAVPVITDDLIEMREPMQWNETFPIPHTWRYGANALAPHEDYSSYDAMDAIVEVLFGQSGELRGGRRFLNLKRIIVAGHSAGGQFTQRWALTSNSPVWGDENEHHWDRWDVTTVSMKRQLIKEYSFKNSSLEVIAIVASPRSYAYLDERRWINSTHFTLPTQDQRESCPTYDSWEWGLQPGGLMAPYKDRALAWFQGDIRKLADRYSKRQVIYVIGHDDTEHLRGSCEDDGFQGENRFERSYLFYKSLQEYYGKMVHSRLVIDCVGHDHSLIFQSAEARDAMFGDCADKL